MIKYIVNTAYGSKIFKVGSIEESKDNNFTIIKKLCIGNLFSYEGYIKAINKIFSKKHNIPVYINDKNIFIPIKRIRDYDNIWINYATILTYRSDNEKVIVIFKDFDELMIDLNYRLFSKRINLLNEIVVYKAV